MRTWALSPAILLSSLGSGSFLELHLEAECSRSLSLLMQPCLPDPLPVCFQSRMEHTPPHSDGPCQAPLHLIGSTWVTRPSLSQSPWPGEHKAMTSTVWDSGSTQTAGPKGPRRVPSGEERVKTPMKSWGGAVLLQSQSHRWPCQGE